MTTGMGRFQIARRVLTQASSPVAFALVTACGQSVDPDLTDSGGPAFDSSVDAAEEPTLDAPFEAEAANCESSIAIANDLAKAIEGAKDCSLNGECVLSGNINLPCFKACSQPVAALQLENLKQVVSSAEFGGLCVCYEQPPECIPSTPGPIGCVEGRCQFL